MAKKMPTNDTRFTCASCSPEEPLLHTEFYKSRNVMHKSGYFPYCKKCMIKYIVEKIEVLRPDIVTCIFLASRKFDFPFDKKYALSVQRRYESGELDEDKVLGAYSTCINSGYLQKTFSFELSEGATVKIDKDQSFIYDDEDTPTGSLEYGRGWQDKRSEIIKLLEGFDPFIDAQERDKPFLYEGLMPYLNDSQVIEDRFKLLSICSILRAFKQVSDIETKIEAISCKPKFTSVDATSLNTLVNVKKSLNGTISQIAKDNEISLKYKTSNETASSDFTGMQKVYEKLDIASAEVNLIDQKTSESMKRIADISNASIVEQLHFDDKDKADMFKELRDKFVRLQEEYDNLLEEDRLFKKKLVSKGVDINV